MAGNEGKEKRTTKNYSKQIDPLLLCFSSAGSTRFLTMFKNVLMNIYIYIRSIIEYLSENKMKCTLEALLMSAC